MCVCVCAACVCVLVCWFLCVCYFDFLFLCVCVHFFVVCVCVCVGVCLFSILIFVVRIIFEAALGCHLGERLVASLRCFIAYLNMCVCWCDVGYDEIQNASVRTSLMLEHKSCVGGDWQLASTKSGRLGSSTVSFFESQPSVCPFSMSAESFLRSKIVEFLPCVFVLRISLNWCVCVRGNWMYE